MGDAILWHAYKGKNTTRVIKHLSCCVEFNEHYYPRPNEFWAMCHEELGDALQAQYPNQMRLCIRAFQRACQLRYILYGIHSMKVVVPYNKLLLAKSLAKGVNMG